MSQPQTESYTAAKVVIAINIKNIVDQMHFSIRQEEKEKL